MHRSRFLVMGVALVMLVTSSSAGAGQIATPADYAPFRFDETVTITLMSGVNSTEAGPPPGDWPWLQRVRDELNIDVQITWITNSPEYTSTLRTRAAANDLPDVFQTDLSTTSLLVDQGLLGDWNPLLQYMPTYVRDHDVQALAPIGTFDEGLYSLVAKNPAPFKGVVAIRQDWLDTLGLEVPTTTDEYLEVARAFTEQDPDGNGSADTYGFTGSVNFEGFIAGFAGFQGAFGDSSPWQVVDGQLVNRAVSEPHRQYIEFMNQVSAAGVIDPDWASQENLDARTKWKAGRIGIIFEDWCALFCIQGYAEFKGANPGGVFTPIQPPVGPGGLASAGELSAAGSQYGISATAIEEGRGEAVARLFEWMNGPGYIATAFGEDGVSYELNAEGRIVQYTNIESFPCRQLVTWAYKGTPEEWQARYESIETYPDGQTVDIYSILEFCGQYPISDTTQWAAMPPAPAGSYADMIRTQAEGEYAFMTGTRSLEEWGAHVEALQAVGVGEWTSQAEERARELGIVE